MSSEFQFDVFLSHSTKDKAIVRPIAERLRKDGLKVWFDEWEIRLGDSIPHKIDKGLENSRILILCMSANAFGADWPEVETQTFRFRDPLNKERRFVPLLLDESPIKGSLKQFRHLVWKQEDEEPYKGLLAACRQNNNEQFFSAQVSMAAVNIGARRIGSGSRFEVKIEAVNEGNLVLGFTGLTINVPTIKSAQIFKALTIRTETNSLRPVEICAPKKEIYGFFENKNSAAVGVAGKFGKSPAENLLIEAIFETWQPQDPIWLKVIFEGPTSIIGSQLAAFVRVWANIPKAGENSKVIGDPPWESSFAKDQQGIPAYSQSIGF